MCAAAHLHARQHRQLCVGPHIPVGLWPWAARASQIHAPGRNWARATDTPRGRSGFTRPVNPDAPRIAPAALRRPLHA